MNETKTRSTMPKKSKRKGKKGKKGKKKVHPDPPPYYPVTLPSPYLFGQIVGKSVQEKDVSEAKAQALVDDANAKTLVLDFKGLHLEIAVSQSFLNLVPNLS